MMAGAAKGHNRICANLVRHLGNRLAGKPCQPYGSDMKFVSPTGNVRYPDVQVDCGPFNAQDLISTEPLVVIEVLSPSNDWFEVGKRLADYQAHASVRHIVLISAQKLRAQVWTRASAGWTQLDAETIETDLDLAALDIALPLAEVYEGVTFEDPVAGP
jgi:Uma2 family endonuclease